MVSISTFLYDHLVRKQLTFQANLIIISISRNYKIDPSRREILCNFDIAFDHNNGLKGKVHYLFKSDRL